MVIVKCRSLFRGNASVGSHIVEEAVNKNQDIRIEHDDSRMTIPVKEFNRFFTFGKGRQYPHQNGRTGFYTLKYIKFVPDQSLGDE